MENEIITEDFIVGDCNGGSVERVNFITYLRDEINKLNETDANPITDDTPITLECDEEEDVSTMTEKDRKKIECELMLSYMDKTYNSDDSIPYWKELKKRIPKFKKEVYSKLTAEEKCMLKMLDLYTMKLINQSIKDCIDDMKDILKQRDK